MTRLRSRWIIAFTLLARAGSRRLARRRAVASSRALGAPPRWRDLRADSPVGLERDARPPCGLPPATSPTVGRAGGCPALRCPAARGGRDTPAGAPETRPSR